MTDEELAAALAQGQADLAAVTARLGDVDPGELLESLRAGAEHRAEDCRASKAQDMEEWLALEAGDQQ